MCTLFSQMSILSAYVLFCFFCTLGCIRFATEKNIQNLCSIFSQMPITSTYVLLLLLLFCSLGCIIITIVKNIQNPCSIFSQTFITSTYVCVCFFCTVGYIMFAFEEKKTFRTLVAFSHRRPLCLYFFNYYFVLLDALYLLWRKTFRICVPFSQRHPLCPHMLFFVLLDALYLLLKNCLESVYCFSD